MEGTISDVGEPGREGDLGQPRARIEGISSDVDEPGREGDLGQPRAKTEGTISNCRRTPIGVIRCRSLLRLARTVLENTTFTADLL